ncbi:MAG TPA: cobalt ECF transporter T component CbiQ [Rhizomicrobium sp.]|nr:cobalt ECF transporter T component CbiQ [Rhizomicrobium sp.]
MRRGFIESTIAGLLTASEYAAAAENLASERGVLQRIDPRVKVAGLFTLIVIAAASRSLALIGAVFAIALVLAAGSRIGPLRLARLVWLPVLFFTGAIAFPAIFLTPGTRLTAVAGLHITHQGLRAASFLIARAETAATLSALLALTTPWPWVLKALRSLGCPLVLVAIFGMTFRYIFVILQTAAEMFESRQSRTVGELKGSDRRRLAASAAGVLLSKSLQLSGDVHLAMQSRGFRGEVYIVHDFRTRLADWLWLSFFIAVAAAAIRFGK